MGGAELVVQARIKSAEVDIGLIASDLATIAKKINSTQNLQPKFIVSIDINATKSLFKEQLSAIVKDIRIQEKPSVSIGGSSTSSTSNVIEELDKQKEQAKSIATEIENARGQINQLFDNNEMVQDFKVAEISLSKIGKAGEETQKKFTSLVNEYNKMSANFKDKDNNMLTTNDLLGKHSEGDLRKYITSLDVLQQKYRDVTKEVAVLNKTQTASLSLASRERAVRKTTIQLESFTKNNSRLFNNPALKNDVQTLKVNLVADDAVTKTKELQTSIDDIIKKTKQMGLEGTTWFSKMGKQAEKLGVYLSSAAILYGAFNQIKVMVSNIVELDTAMVELRKVTNESETAYTQFFQRSIQNAQSLGTSVKDVINVTADFARLGYGVKDAEEMANSAIIFKNVGESMVSGFKEVNDLLVEKCTNELQSEINSLEPEDIERTKLSLNLLSEWMSKGMEIYSCIDSSQEIKDLFPTQDKQTAIIEPAKQLTNSENDEI